jgi:glycosyltransferase involved in cell wall biosynthesis
VLDRQILRRIHPGDAVVVSGYLPTPILGDLVASNIPFHADYYCITAPEILRYPATNFIREFRQRRSRILRYEVTIRRAERAYVSNLLQTAFLGGAFFSSLRSGTRAFIDDIPSRIFEFPMGVSEHPFPTDAPNPYPTELHGRPVFLWGGGIWSWFDVPTLLRAMKFLSEQGSNAALFFIGGRRLSGREEHERPIRQAISLSEELGLSGRSVFFNERAARVEELPGYLFHAAAGVMANPASFEALASWRTRYLDLLWAGRPLIASGHDPLGHRMCEVGAARMVKAGDHEAFAGAISEIASIPSTRVEMGEASRRLGRSMGWSKLARPLLDSVDNPDGFRQIPSRPNRAWMLRNRLGI